MKKRVQRLIKELHRRGEGPGSLRAFCLGHDINYGSLSNAIANGSLGIQTVHAFKRAVPDLNMNWFLYGEGPVFVPRMSQRLGKGINIQ